MDRKLDQKMDWKMDDKNKCHWIAPRPTIQSLPKIPKMFRKFSQTHVKVLFYYKKWSSWGCPFEKQSQEISGEKWLNRAPHQTVLRQDLAPGLSSFPTCRAAAARLPWRGSAATRGARPGAASTGAAAAEGGTTGTPPPPPGTAKRRAKPRNLRFETHTHTLRRKKILLSRP